MSDNLRFLVLDGYLKASRNELSAGGASAAGTLYKNMLQHHAPGAHVDIAYPADPQSALPQGAAIAAYDGIAWTGSSLNIYNNTPEVTRQIALAQTAFEAGVPSFGSCWAVQIAVVAAGGACAPNPKGREIFVARKISLTAEGRDHPLYDGKKPVFDGWISHDDEVTQLPASATLLASNDFTHVQAVSVTHKKGTFWAVQYHPEYDVHEMARLIYCREQVLTDKGFFANVEAAQNFVDRLETLHENLDRKDLAFELGLDADILDRHIRQKEVRNWIEKLVIPTAAASR